MCCGTGEKSHEFRHLGLCRRSSSRATERGLKIVARTRQHAIHRLRRRHDLRDSHRRNRRSCSHRWRSGHLQRRRRRRTSEAKRRPLRRRRRRQILGLRGTLDIRTEVGSSTIRPSGALDRDSTNSIRALHCRKHQVVEIMLAGESMLSAEPREPSRRFGRDDTNSHTDLDRQGTIASGDCICPIRRHFSMRRMLLDSRREGSSPTLPQCLEWDSTASCTRGSAFTSARIARSSKPTASSPKAAC